MTTLRHQLTACLTLDAVLTSADVSLDAQRLLTLTSVRGGEVCVWNASSVRASNAAS